ncbi:MAG: fibronectin type III domain-containing protein [Ekhidna sp.]|uniref:fibronectin type III domain-containing protein n=1 Tax=Ekhidna sp. TaxID=2608089 RepID=UPI0032EF7E8C
MSFIISRANPLRFVIKSPANLVGPGRDGQLYADQYHFGIHDMDPYIQPMAKDSWFQFNTDYSTNNISIRKVTDPDTVVQSLSKIEFPTDYLKFVVSPSSLEYGERYFIQIDSFEGGQPDIQVVSEPFKALAENKRVVTIDYYNYDDAFGVNYNTPVRLFAVGIEGSFCDEVPIGDRTGFVDDAGLISTLSSFNHRGIRLQTGHLPGHLHNIIKLALSHDYIRIDGIVCQPVEPYEWEFEDGSSLAQGTAVMQVVEDAMINRHETRTTFSFPAAPSDFTFSGIGDPLNVTANWTDNSSDETGFEIEYQLDGGEWTHWETTAANAETHNENISAWDPGETLRLRIRAVNANGYSEWVYGKTAWILEDGTWNDGGIWQDNEFWND